MSYAEYIASLSDDDLWDRAGTDALAWADACRELHRRLVESRQETEQERTRADANRQIMDGEQANFKQALTHLEALWKAAQDADEDFNFSEKGYP